MNNYYNILEIQNKSIKLLICYLLNDQVKVVYSHEEKLKVPFIGADVLDVGSLSDDIAKICKVDAKELDFKCDVKDVILVIPSFGLEVFSSSKTTNTISQISKINKVDITNLFSMVRKEKVPNPNSEFINIIPNYFAIERDQTFLRAPIGYKSSFIAMSANVYTLPKKAIDDMKKAVTGAGIRINSVYASAVCAPEAIFKRHFKYKDYIYVDVSEKNTFMTLVGDNKVVAHTNFDKGLDTIVKGISDEFHLSYEESLKLANVFGYDDSSYTYNPQIHEGVTKNQINNIIGNLFKDWSSYFYSNIRILLSNNENYINRIPLIINGVGLSVNGFKNFISRNYPTNPIEYSEGDIIGAEDNKYIDLVGAVYLEKEIGMNFIDEPLETKIEIEVEDRKGE
ncbi:MAG: hypothetical protein IJ656_00825 [Bacilli bacterium]|nr:hypothetical protein [Bacilli bacterium]